MEKIEQKQVFEPDKMNENGPGACSNPLNPNLDRLIELLDRLAGLLADMITLTGDEKQAAMDSEADALLEFARKKEVLILQIQEVETQRIHALHQSAGNLGISSEKLTLTKLAECVPVPYDTELKSRSTGLSTLLQKMAAITRDSRFLIRHSQDLVRGARELLEKLISPPLTYQVTGTYRQHRQKGNVLSGRI